MARNTDTQACPSCKKEWKRSMPMTIEEYGDLEAIKFDCYVCH